MAIRIICLFLLSCSFATSAQDSNFPEYFRHSRLAKQHDSLQNYEQAVNHYDSMLMNVDFHPWDYFYAFQSAWRNGDREKSLEYVNRGALKGLDVRNNWIGEEIDGFLISDYGRIYREHVDSLLEIHFNSIDLEYKGKLDSLVKIDQFNRDLSEKMYYADSLNFEALIKLSEERGFPTFPTVGYGCNQAQLLLWHHRNPEFPDSDQWKRIMPYINEQIAKGALDPNFLFGFDM